MENDAIVALSTPPGESGIAVVRISGSSALRLLDAMAPGARLAPSRTLSPLALSDGSGESIDEALVAVMRAPGSYTGEDMVEISCHGSMQVVSDLIDEIVRLGARIAAPGEFTKRAFLNGKLDLAQAEAVVDLISAETKLQRKIALEQLGGALSRKVRSLEESLLDELALIEAAIDFSEEDLPVYDPRDTLEAARKARAAIAALLESEIAGERLRRGIRVTILGGPNVGKSSLYNALLGEERAIVSPIAGTTRDILRERIHIGGFTCRLEDTAGIAETSCEVEAKGIEIARAAALRADLVLFVVDGSEEITSETSDEISRIAPDKLLCVLNKSDLGLRCSSDEARARLGARDLIVVSALTREGLESVRVWIFDKTVKRAAGDLDRERIAVNARQAAALREADEALERLSTAIETGEHAEILSVETRCALDALGAITGRSMSDALLETIFTKFCIGK
ncbi:MAG: tRNA uridine-5-carboxymethylaminomethyl(34) synthesis GTPase MnmE [Candidatus Krumholzibacteria bacterium]|nr:tRNA uridine-5-carboxymethylaminomethyl(34) synthesis GTPase MnmE [Candidatus Krumholzibacteria bacterium]